MVEKGQTSREMLGQLKMLVILSGVQLLVLVVLGLILLVVGLPKLERAVLVMERFEGKFNTFTERVEPVMERVLTPPEPKLPPQRPQPVVDPATEDALKLLDKATGRINELLNEDFPK